MSLLIHAETQSRPFKSLFWGAENPVSLSLIKMPASIVFIFLRLNQWAGERKGQNRSDEVATPVSSHNLVLSDGESEVSPWQTLFQDGYPGLQVESSCCRCNDQKGYCGPKGPWWGPLAPAGLHGPKLSRFQVLVRKMSLVESMPVSPLLADFCTRLQ